MQPWISIIMSIEVYAHRGGGGYFVENTLPAFRNAIRLGCDGAELDVHLSADGEVMVHHNPTLNYCYTRGSDGSWLKREERLEIGQLSAAELATYKTGLPNPDSGYPADFNLVRSDLESTIPRLDEVISEVQSLSKNFRLVIELKADIFATDIDKREKLCRRVLEVIEATGFRRRALVCGFDWRLLRHMRELAPGLETWFTTQPMSWWFGEQVPASDLSPTYSYVAKLRALLSESNAQWFDGFQPDAPGALAEKIAQAGGDAWFCYYTDCTRETVESARKAGIKLYAWSVNVRDPDVAQRLEDIGVDGYCTDYPFFEMNGPEG